MKVVYLILGLVMGIVSVWPITAQQPAFPGPQSGLARVDGAASRIADFGADLHVELALSQPVPWRIFTLDAPWRVVLDFSEVDFDGSDLAALVHSDVVADLRMGPYQDGWSRLVVELSEPFRIDTAALTPVTGAGSVALKLQLAPTDANGFAATAGEPESVRFTLPEPVADGASAAPTDAETGARPLRIVLDPGHGGLDAGVGFHGLSEADTALAFARDLRDDLEAAGMEVAMTREQDHYLPVAQRVAMAGGADLFLSIHASASGQGGVSGATIYTFSDAPTDDAAAVVAGDHDRADLLAGSTWRAAASAGTEAAVQAEALADALVLGLARRTGDLRKQPRIRAAFTVLQAPETPSVLLELGLLSSPKDRAKLRDAAWRAEAIAGIREAIESWRTGSDAPSRQVRN